jgi:Cytochrome c.
MRQWRTSSAPGAKFGSCLRRSARELRLRSPSAPSRTRRAITASARRRCRRRGAGSSPTAPTYPTVSPQVAAGAHTFVQFACVQCHGALGRGGVDPAVPALNTVGQSLTVAQLTHIINHGLGASADPKQPYMPVWGEVISKRRSRTSSPTSRPVCHRSPTRSRSRSRRDREPRSPAPPSIVRYGCVNCHGPNGLGGVPNPLSPDKTIPPLSGQGFRHDFPTDKAIADVIRSGSVIGRADREHAALGRDPLRPADRRAGRLPEDAQVAVIPIQRCRRRNVVRKPRRGQKRDESRFVSRQSVTIVS